MKPKVQQQLMNRKTTTLSTLSTLKNKNQHTPSRLSAFPSNGIRNNLINYSENIISKLPNITSTNWCLYDSDTNRLLGLRENMQRQVGSLTKIMTCIVVINLIQRYLMHKDVLVKISRTSSQLGGTTAQLKYAKWLTIQDLLYGAMLPSGNDAAYLLAEVFGLLLYYQPVKSSDKEYADIQSIDISLYDNTLPFISKFLKQMNKKAKELKMTRTSFANPHGLANTLNFSTAHDIMILSRYSCTLPEFRKISNTLQYKCQLLEDDLQTVYQTKNWTTTNKLLCRGWQGVKTGQTIPAGACLASLKDDIYIIILNSENAEARFDETQTLHNWYQAIKLEQ